MYFHQIGPDQDGFFRFWERELGPALRERGLSHDARRTMPKTADTYRPSCAVTALEDIRL